MAVSVEAFWHHPGSKDMKDANVRFLLVTSHCAIIYSLVLGIFAEKLETPKHAQLLHSQILPNCQQACRPVLLVWSKIWAGVKALLGIPLCPHYQMERERNGTWHDLWRMVERARWSIIGDERARGHIHWLASYPKNRSMWTSFQFFNHGLVQWAINCWRKATSILMWKRLTRLFEGGRIDPVLLYLDNLSPWLHDKKINPPAWHSLASSLFF